MDIEHIGQLGAEEQAATVCASGWLVSRPLDSSSIACCASAMSKAVQILSNTPQPSSETSSCTWLGVWRKDTVTLVPPLWSAALLTNSVKPCRIIRATCGGSAKCGAKSRCQGRSSSRPCKV
jgi:hypothetical protein